MKQRNASSPNLEAGLPSSASFVVGTGTSTPDQTQQRRVQKVPSCHRIFHVEKIGNGGLNASRDQLDATPLLPPPDHVNYASEPIADGEEQAPERKRSEANGLGELQKGS